MPSYLCISVTFHDGTFHGRHDHGEPEWPPSPLRLFQAIVCAAARRCPESFGADIPWKSIRWLECQPAPRIIAPRYHIGSPMRIAVPNNDLNVIAAAWAKGQEPGKTPSELKTMKTVRPTRVIDAQPLHYLWKLPSSSTSEIDGHTDVLSHVARSVVALGWGIDLVAGSARVISEGEAEALTGECWLPNNQRSVQGLRVPILGTLAELSERHLAFLGRLPSKSAFNPVPQLSVFRKVEYRRATESPARPFAAFQLLKPDASGFRAFNSVRDIRTVVGMMRHAVRRAAEQAEWPPAEVASFVLGHGEANDGGRHVPVGPNRFAYIPIPSIEPRGSEGARVVGAVRRILLTSFADGCDDRITWARRALSGTELINEEKEVVAITSLIPSSDRILRNYSESASVWSTVNPVVLPGYDDQAPAKVDSLLRKAIVHAGFSETLAKHADLECRYVGFWPGTDLANRYRVPDYLRTFPRYHVRLSWRSERGEPVAIQGPICLGGGRFVGIGLFAAERD